MWTEKELIDWEGYRPTHENITVQDIEAKRQAMPDIEVIAHPECRPEVIEAADFVYGTSGMLTTLV